jgi:hypothetical protein
LWALQSSTTWDRDLELKGFDEMSSLAASLSLVEDLIEGRVDAAATNRVRWGSWLALTAALSYFSELEPELDLLGSGRNADLTKDQIEPLWAQMRRASESVMLSVPPSVACNSPDGGGEEVR